MKKKKEKKPQFVVGKKIREIKIDKKQQMVELAFAVAAFAVILLGGLLSLGLMFNKWYVWMICGILLVYFLTHSITSVMRAASHPKYILHENCLVLNSIWHYGIIPLRSITKIETKNTIFDSKEEKSISIVVHYEDDGDKKMTLHSVTENIHNVINAIDEQVKKFKMKID